MKSRRPSLILLPCHSLDDFPVYHRGDDASSLLASWTVLWHPLLLAASQGVPTWGRIDTPPEQVDNQIIMVPQVGYRELATGFAARVQEAGGKLIRGTADRQELATSALEFIESESSLDDDLVADFYALGYCYLQVQLLTRHMRYSSKLDNLHFNNQVVAAANAAVANDHATMGERLQRCFDLLTEEREHFYPVDVRLMDLVVMPPFDQPQRLEPELRRKHPVSMLGPASVWREWLEQGDGDAYRAAVADGLWHLVGGEENEARTPLLSHESLVNGLQQGLARFQTEFGTRPSVYGRRRFGLCWGYPQALTLAGFRGALHLSLDDGRFPEGLQLKTRWEGSDHGTIDAFARIPHDAALPETFLRLAIKIGEMLDSDHAAAVAFVRWPGSASPFFEDLQRASRYSGALGRFVSLETFFKEHQEPGLTDRFLPDQYRSPYLQQAVIRGQLNPISSLRTYWRGQHTWSAATALTAIHDLLDNRLGADSQVKHGQTDLDRAEENAGDMTAAGQAISEHLETVANRTAGLLGRGGKGRGFLVLNPTSVVRRMGVRLPLGTPLPKIERPIYAADRAEDGVDVVVDVPAMGYVWINAEGSGASAMSGPPLGEEFILRNEFFETTVDRHSGGIRTFHEYNVRANRLSQQLAIRYSDGERPYTSMQADSIETIRLNRACGEIRTRGRLVNDEEKVLAEFEQTLRVWRGTRILEIEGRLKPLEPLGSEPWRSYACQRLVWREQASDVWRDILQTRMAAGPKRLEAPQFVEIEFAPKRTTLLTGGHAFHRRPELHHLDTLLQVRGESVHDFRMGLVLDHAYPSALAQHFDTPAIVLADQPCPAQGASGWLLHVDAKNVLINHWSLIGEPGGEPKGFRVRLLETVGRPAKVRVTSVREPASAHRIDLGGQRLEPCVVADSRIELELAPQELAEIEVLFQA